MSKVKGTRLSDERAAWVEEYAAARGIDAATVLRMAVDHFVGVCEGGVPDLPAPATPIPAWKTPLGDALAAGRAEYAKNISARQRKLNDAKERASR